LSNPSAWLDREVLWCDAIAFEANLDAGEVC
jgi:hypothetical protein